MNEKRSYCLADKPFPVSARAMRTLRLIAEDGGWPKTAAVTQIERLQRSGYLRDMHGVFVITDAGRALLDRQLSKATK